MVRSRLGKAVAAGLLLAVVLAVVVGLARDDLRVIVGVLLLPVLVYLIVVNQRDRRRDEEYAATSSAWALAGGRIGLTWPPP